MFLNHLRAKARLAAQGYAQIEDLNVGKMFGLVTRLEAIRLFFGLACICKVKL